jgi:hypothetical protein
MPRRLTGSETNSAPEREVTRLLRQIQALTLELRQLTRGPHSAAEVVAKERALEQLRWRFASAARRAARDGFGSAA